MNLVILIQETPLLLSIYRKLRSIAQIVPYYLVREQLLEPDRVDIHPRLAPLDVLWLSADDMKAISQNKEVRESEATLRRRIEEGLRCLALVHQGKVAAYTWCNLKACQASRKFNITLKCYNSKWFEVSRRIRG